MKCLSSNTLIISNFSEDSISIVDLDSGKETQRIRLNSGGQHSSSPQFGPHHIALDYETKILYVPNSWHNSLSVVDIEQGKTIDQVFVGSCPSQVIICEKYDTIYVANTDSNSVSVLSLDRLDLVINIPTGQMPHGMAMSKDQERIFVGNYGSQEITEIISRTNEKLKNHIVNCNPWHLRIDEDGDFLFVVNYSDQFSRKGKVVLYDTKDLKEVKLIEIGKMPVEVVYHKKSETLYITDSDLDCVHVYDLRTDRCLERIKVSTMPHGIELDAEGERIFVTSIQKNVIDIIHMGKKEVIQSILVGQEPTSIIKG